MMIIVMIIIIIIARFPPALRCAGRLPSVDGVSTGRKPRPGVKNNMLLCC